MADKSKPDPACHRALKLARTIADLAGGDRTYRCMWLSEHDSWQTPECTHKEASSERLRT